MWIGGHFLAKTIVSKRGGHKGSDVKSRARIADDLVNIQISNMFQRLANLFFGRLDDTTMNHKPGAVDEEEEGWLLVSVPEGQTSTEPNSLMEAPASASVCRLRISQANTESVVSSLDRESSTLSHSNDSSRVSRGIASQAGALAKVTQVARVQRAKARADRYHLGRRHLQRQNRICQRLPRCTAHKKSTVLHQPRNSSH